MCRATSDEDQDVGPQLNASLTDFFPLLDNDDLAQYAVQYPLTSFTGLRQQIIVVMGDSTLKCAVRVPS